MCCDWILLRNVMVAFAFAFAFAEGVGGHEGMKQGEVGIPGLLGRNAAFRFFSNSYLFMPQFCIVLPHLPGHTHTHRFHGLYGVVGCVCTFLGRFGVVCLSASRRNSPPSLPPHALLFPYVYVAPSLTLTSLPLCLYMLTDSLSSATKARNKQSWVVDNNKPSAPLKPPPASTTWTWTTRWWASGRSRSWG